MIPHFRSALTLSCILATSTLLSAQSVVLKDGTRIDQNSLILKEGKFTRSLTLRNGAKAEVAVNTTDISHLDWPNVTELLTAQGLLAEGKTQEAINLLAKTREYFAPFKAVKGTPYQQVSLAYLEALDQSGDFESMLRLMPELEAMKWSEVELLKFRILKLNIQRRTSSNHEALLQQAQEILATTDDSNISARLWMTIGDIELRREDFEAALKAVLHVPVFYGSQTALVPQSELFAARCLVKLERFADASQFYQRIVDSYAASEIAEIANKELQTIKGLPNKKPSPTQPANNSQTSSQ